MPLYNEVHIQYSDFIEISMFFYRQGRKILRLFGHLNVILHTFRCGPSKPKIRKKMLNVTYLGAWA